MATFNPRRITEKLSRWIAAQPKSHTVAFCLVLVPIIGVADYLTGTRLSLLPVYFAPVFIAVWYVNARFAFVITLLSVLLISAAAYSPNRSAQIIQLWNVSIRFFVYSVFILVLSRLKSLQSNLQSMVLQKATELTREIYERKSLEEKIHQIGEREQRRIGQDLHDGLCQLLTGTAIASHLLTEKLSSQGLKEAQESQTIHKLVVEANNLARQVAKGLHPVEFQADGLMQALEEFAFTTSELFKNSCAFECASPVMIDSPATATHLFRIAQEAVSNAIRHGRATEIIIALECEEGDLIKLSVADNGSGMPQSTAGGDGMGLRIMAGRSRIIGGTFSVNRRGSGGTEVNCIVPLRYAG